MKNDSIENCYFYSCKNQFILHRRVNVTACVRQLQIENKWGNNIVFTLWINQHENNLTDIIVKMSLFFHKTVLIL